jgi:anti-sigma regulatory factor (Ser/Thr protein kinase)
MKKIIVPAKIENMDEVIRFITGELDGLNCSPKAAAQIGIAVDEVFSNIARYAYTEPVYATPGAGGDVTVYVETEKNPPAVNIIFSDSGRPFNPLEAPPPDTTLSADERKIGGLGIFMTGKLMDEETLAYKYENGRNVLSMRKTLRNEVCEIKERETSELSAEELETVTGGSWRVYGNKQHVFY